MPPPPPARTLKQRVRGAWRALDRSPRAVWLKKIVGFPIGERFAAISITAAIWDARVTFIVMLVWGGFAATYTLAGRVLRSLGKRGPVALTAGGDTATGALDAYRDDGPIALALGRIGVGSVPASALVLAGLLPLLAAIAIAGAARRGGSRAPSWPGSCSPPASRAAGRCATACAGSSRPRCAWRSTPGSCGSPRSRARPPCRRRSRCCWRSRSASTTSSTACAIAA